MGVGVRQKLDEPQGNELPIFISWLAEQIGRNKRGSALDQVQRGSDGRGLVFRAALAGRAGTFHGGEWKF